MVESSDKTCSTGEGAGTPLQYSCLENPINRMKRQKDMTLKDELPRSVGAQYATRDFVCAIDIPDIAISIAESSTIFFILVVLGYF